MALTVKTERDNFSRFGQGIVGIGSTMARDLLISYISPTDLVIKVRPGHPVWSSLDQQQKTLVQNAGVDGYIKFDISLTYKLLRHVCTNLRDPSKIDLGAPAGGWGKDPAPADISSSDDLERIRILRNKVYGHVHQASLSEPEYQRHWRELKDVAFRMGTLLSKTYLTELQELEHYKLSDAQVKDLIKEMKEFEKRIDEHDSQLHDLCKRIDDHDGLLDEHGKNLDGHGRQIDEYGRQIDDHGRQIDDYGRQIHSQELRIQGQQVEMANMKQGMPTGKTPSKFNKLVRRIFHRGSNHDDDEEFKKKLCQINDLETRVIPVAPLQEAYKLPIELLYASVVIREDFKYTTRRMNMKPQEHKVVKTPDDIFKIGKASTECVYLLGDAAHGKTTYCLWLIKKWCRAQQRSTRVLRQNAWGKALKEFDYVFFVPLRRVNASRAFLIDMICMDILRQYQSLCEKVKLVLGNKKYRCLIFIDGLDEWKPSLYVLEHLTCKALPNFDNISNCVFFITMRPWIFPSLSESVRDVDRVIEIQGLDDDGIKTVTKNVLVNHYGMNPKKQEFIEKYNEIIHKLENETMKSFIQIPLLAVVCVQIWYEEKQVGDSMTSFYAVMIDMLIERAYQKHKLEIECDKPEDGTLPKILSDNENIKERISILRKLGKVAYEGLLSNETSLVFQKRKLEKEIGVKELQFALDVGLISQEEATSIVKKNVSVHFFHKSVQESLAVIYIVTQTEIRDSFCKQLSNVKVIMELSNVIMFICGMCPSLGSDISQRVVSVTDSDPEICEYRKSSGYNNAVIELYKLQAKWYRELKYGQILTGSPVSFHVSDVYLDDDSDKELVKVTRELLSDHCNDIRSLCILLVNRDKCEGIADTDINTFLAKTENKKSIVKLCIDGHPSERLLDMICIPTLVVLDLQNVQINKPGIIGHPYPDFLTGMTDLKHLRLYKVVLGDERLRVSADMVCIENVLLEYVEMVAAEWEQFILSLTDLHQECFVDLDKTNIDEKSLSMIRSSSHFKVQKDVVTEDGRHISFHRVAQVKQ